MNEETKIYFALSIMYEYVKDICTICEGRNFNYESIIEDMVTKHAVNMCLVQLGEQANRIKKIDENFYRNNNMCLPQIKGLRDRITHSYGHIDYKVIKDILKNDIPALKKAIESHVHQEILDNPYVLYEMEYKDFLNTLQHQKTPLDFKIKAANSRTAEVSTTTDPNAKTLEIEH